MAKKDLTPLVIKAQAGDEQALSDLMSECYETLYYYAYNNVKDQDLAGDITQESCIEIMETLGNLRDPGAFRTWAGRIVYHQCTRHFKQTKEVPLEENEDGETILDQLPDESRGSVPEQVQEDKEFQQTILDMLNSLPAQQRSAMLLYYYENLSVGQIAQIQGEPEGTIKSRLNYGRKAIKNKVDEYEKKHGVRLHSITPLPLLLYWLFRQDALEAVGAASKTLAKIWAGISGTTAAAAAGTAGAAAATAATASTVGAVSTGIVTKVVAVVAAVIVSVSAIVGGITIANRDKKEDPETQTTTQQTQETTQAPVNHGTMEQWSAFFGTWYGGVDNAPILEFAENTLTLTGRTFAWTLEDCAYYAEEGYAGLDVTDGEGNYFSVSFNLMPEGCWNAEIVQLLPSEDPNIWYPMDDGEWYYVYRPADYEGYTLVTLTPENALDYIVREPSRYKYFEDEYVSGLMGIQPQGFREGLGSASFARFVPLIRVTYYTATPEEAVAGIKHFDGRSGIYADFEYPEMIYYPATQEDGAIQSLDNLRDGKLHLSDREYIGVAAVQGYVLVPEGYQLPERKADPDAAWLDEIRGHWTPIPDFMTESPEGITINSDGTITLSGITGHIRHLSYTPAEYGREERVSLEILWEDPEQIKVLEGTLEFIRHPDGNLLLQYLMKNPEDPDSYLSDTFYKAENYQRITLTAENLFDYVECVSGIYTMEDTLEDGSVDAYVIQAGTVFRFKNGVGLPSYVRASALGSCTIYQTTLDANGTATAQQQLSQEQKEAWIDIAASMWHYTGNQSVQYFYFEDGIPETVTWESWTDLQVTDCYGEIYVPVNE